MNLEKELSNVKTVAVTGHVRPDGDCVGSVMALYNYIVKNMPSIQVDAYLEQPGNEFHYITNLDKIKSDAQETMSYDVFIVLDCSDLERIKPFLGYFYNAKKTICIDHHASNNAYADMNHVIPTASSTCEVLYGTFDEDKVDKDIAECIYTGIIHDTGVFKYSCTSKDTMLIAGKLMEKGIPYSDIIDNSFYKKTFQQNKVLGRALLDSILFHNGKCIYSVIYKKDMALFDVDGKGLGGIIEQLRLTEGVEVAIFLYETDVNEFKLSMRSKNYIDVSQIALKFGGGGHIRAAGATMTGSVDEIIQNIKVHLDEQFEIFDK